MRSARRFNKPKKIGGGVSEEEDEGGDGGLGSGSGGGDRMPVVIKNKKKMKKLPVSASVSSSNTPPPPPPHPPLPAKTSSRKRPLATDGTSSEPATPGLSFTEPGFTADGDDDASEPFQIKKSALSRRARERAAAARASRPKGRALPLPLPQRAEEEQMEESTSLYSEAYLEELRNLTPSAPIQGAAADDDYGANSEDLGNPVMTYTDPNDPLGTLSKFGTTAATATAAAAPSSAALSTMSGTSIPDPALVKILKARRAARVANSNKPNAEEFISLSPDNSDASGTDQWRSKKKKPTRLVRTEILDEDDDPELASFVNDPSAATPTAHPTRLVLTNALSSRKGAQTAERHLRRGQIQEALALSSSNDSSASTPSGDSDSDAGPNHRSWHSRQLHIATGGKEAANSPTSSLEARLSYQPPNIPPVPDLADCIKRLQATLAEMVRIRDNTAKRVEEVRAEQKEIEKRKKEVQEGLETLGKECERLGLGDAKKLAEGVSTTNSDGTPSLASMGRGLETFGEPSHPSSLDNATDGVEGSL